MNRDLRPMVICAWALLLVALIFEPGFACDQLTCEEMSALRGGCQQANATLVLCGNQPDPTMHCGDYMCNEYAPCVEKAIRQDLVLACYAVQYGDYYLGSVKTCGLKAQCYCPLEPGQTGIAQCQDPSFYSYAGTYRECLPK